MPRQWYKVPVREREGWKFEQVLTEVMAECGIESLDELYLRYVEAGGTWEKEPWMRHVRGEDWFCSPEFFSPLREALGLEPKMWALPLPRLGITGEGRDWELYRRLLMFYGGAGPKDD